MTDFNINPYGQSAVMPEGYPLSNSLDENNAQKALTAAMGYKLARMSGGKHWQGKKWFAYGASLTQYGKYTAPLAAMSGMQLTNIAAAESTGGYGITGSDPRVRNTIMRTTDGKGTADLITIEIMGNEMSYPFGDELDGINTDGTTPADVYDTWIGTFVQCILYLQRNTNAQIVVFPFTESRYVYQHPETPVTPNKQYADGTTLAQRREIVKRVCNMYGVYYIDPNNCLPYVRKAKNDNYLYDQVHYTDLGGYVVAEYLWSKIKDIPLWRTSIPS